MDCTLSNTTFQIKDSRSIYQHKCLCICEHKSEGDRYGVGLHSLNTTFQLRVIIAFTIIGVHVFVNTNQKEIDMEWTTLSATLLTKLRGKQTYTIINVCVFVDTIQKDIVYGVDTTSLQAPLPN